MSSKASSSLGVGISSLLVIFIILCLTTFASLSAVSSAADYRLAQKTASVISDYYLAESTGERELARLAQSLKEGSLTPDGLLTLGWTSGGDGVLTRSVPIGSTQALQISVNIGTGSPQVLRWQVENTTLWVPDDELQLWAGPDA